jgi:hypothetical protein
MIELEEYKKFMKESFAGVSPRIRIETATDWRELYPIVQLHFGQSYLSYQTIFTFSPVARMVIFIPVRFGNGWYQIEDWANSRHIDDPENFHKAVYDFIHELKEYEKREKIFKMKMEARKYAC